VNYYKSVKIKFDRKEVKHFKNNSETNGKNENMNDIELLKKE